MQQSAPDASALAMSPEYCIPPSAITGIPCFAATLAQSKIAVTCGTPVPATMRVVQIEPGPMPTLIASAPASISASAASGVAMLPATICDVGPARLQLAHHLDDRLRVAVGGVDDEDVDVLARSAPRRAPRRPCRRRPPRRRAGGPRSSFVASGYWIFFWMSLTVMSPLRRPSSSTIGSFSILCLPRSASACSSVVPIGAGDEVLGGHEVADRRVEPDAEAQVAVRQDPDEVAALVGDRDAGDPVASTSAPRASETSVVGRQA